MTREDLKDLVHLDPARFDSREYTALCWVRTTLTIKEGASAEITEMFERAFEPWEREYIVAAVKVLYFVNLAVNTLFAPVERLLGRREERPAALPIQGGRDESGAVL